VKLFAPNETKCYRQPSMRVFKDLLPEDVCNFMFRKESVFARRFVCQFWDCGRRLMAFGLASLGLAGSLSGQPIITSSPRPVDVVAGGRAVFSTMASGTLPLSYQWQTSGVPVVEATNDVLVLNHARISDAGQ
jgi:hypothetical protein